MKVIVIGAGLAGMASALMAREAGHSVKIVSKGIGGLLLSSGTLDVFGWRPDGAPADAPLTEFDALPADHPYRQIGTDHVRAGVEWLVSRSTLFQPLTDHNQWIATAVGAVRPTLGLQKTMLGLEDGQKLVVVGLKQFKDFPAALIADNLTRSPHVDLQARDVTIDLPVRNPEADSTGTTAARALDADAQVLIEKLRGLAEPDEIILLPAILGFDAATYARVAAEIGSRVAEVPVPPPSVPGRRLNDELLAALKAARIDIAYNAQVVGCDHDGDTISALHVQRAGRVTHDRVDAVIYAGGGFESGSLHRFPDGRIVERTFDLPVNATEGIFDSGISIDTQMRPLADGVARFSNLHLAGSIIGGAQPWAEKSGEGIALGSAHAAVSALSDTSALTNKEATR